MFKCWWEGARREGTHQKEWESWGCVQEGMGLGAGARRISLRGGTFSMAQERKLRLQSCLYVWWQEVIPRPFRKLVTLSRKSGFSKKLSVYGRHHSIHFHHSCKKEAGIFFITDCTDALQSKIASFQSNSVTELRPAISVFSLLNMLPPQIGKQYGKNDNTVK